MSALFLPPRPLRIDPSELSRGGRNNVIQATKSFLFAAAVLFIGARAISSKLEPDAIWTDGVPVTVVEHTTEYEDYTFFMIPIGFTYDVEAQYLDPEGLVHRKNFRFSLLGRGGESSLPPLAIRVDPKQPSRAAISREVEAGFFARWSTYLFLAGFLAFLLYQGGVFVRQELQRRRALRMFAEDGLEVPCELRSMERRRGIYEVAFTLPESETVVRRQRLSPPLIVEHEGLDYVIGLTSPRDITGTWTLLEADLRPFDLSPEERAAVLARASDANLGDLPPFT